MADGGGKIDRFAFTGCYDCDVRLNFLAHESFRARGRRDDSSVDYVAVEDFPLGKIEIEGVCHENVTLASFAELLAKSEQCGLDNLKNDAAALGAATGPLDAQGCHAHDYCISVSAE